MKSALRPSPPDPRGSIIDHPAYRDFREGKGECKERISTESGLCGDVYVVGRCVAPISRVMLHYLMDRTSASGGVILDRLKLKSRLRRLVRGGLGAALLFQVEAFGVGDLPVWG